MSKRSGDRPERPPNADIKKAVRLVADVLGQRGTPKMAAALGRALAECAPRSDHGRLLARTIQVIKSGGPVMDVDVRRVRPLAQAGTVPTPASVRALAESERAAARSAVKRRELVEAAVQRDGRSAAVYVAAVVRSAGTGPTWMELATAMGWPHRVAAPVIRELERAGWLRTGQAARSLRPGPRLSMHGPVAAGLVTPGAGPSAAPPARPVVRPIRQLPPSAAVVRPPFARGRRAS